ncbi:MAG TPA: hypothetical protein QGF58_20580 [Myxococcota bacterium]|nr:hypothetical protein [Myxococcota bacterium]
MRSEFLALVLLAACDVPGGGEAGEPQQDTGGVIEVVLSPDRPQTADDLLVGVTTSDNTSAISTAWFRDNEEIVGLEGLVIPADQTQKGESWRVVVTPELDGPREPPLSAKVLIVNTPPVVDDVVLESGDVTQPLIAQVTTSDEDGDPVSLAYQWAVDGAALETQISSSLPAGLALRDQLVEVSVTPDDGEEVGEELKQYAVIDNAAPSVASATIEVEDNMLSVSTTGWEDADDDPAAFRYAWHVDDDAVPGSLSSLDLDDYAGAETVYCVVTPYDGRTEGEPVTTAVVLVGS